MAVASLSYIRRTAATATKSRAAQGRALGRDMRGAWHALRLAVAQRLRNTSSHRVPPSCMPAASGQSPDHATCARNQQRWLAAMRSQRAWIRAIALIPLLAYGGGSGSHFPGRSGKTKICPESVQYININTANFSLLSCEYSTTSNNFSMCSSQPSANRPASRPVNVGGFILWNLANTSSISPICRVTSSTSTCLARWRKGISCCSTSSSLPGALDSPSICLAILLLPLLGGIYQNSEISPQQGSSKQIKYTALAALRKLSSSYYKFESKAVKEQTSYRSTIVKTTNYATNSRSSNLAIPVSKLSKLQQKSSSTYSDLSPTQILVLISFHSKAEASRIWFSKKYPKRRSSYLSKRRSVGVTLRTTDPANAPQILITSASSNTLVYTVPLINVDI
ncbi:cell division cycle 20.2, cofactor of APC complex-like [Dorcoceras hygrometricum]|uniref:Cell division cycle 20.2, cofactor of APC complex-like n=1 Tax=Dorcoceras hygrometricum TaxID=472368 RepID=A0A2Z7A9K0_9LAMI|nr:cell division cycle 20.2, cofactor of APC complex-like [Dorcoceras hygrometricum]